MSGMPQGINGAAAARGAWQALRSQGLKRRCMGARRALQGWPPLTAPPDHRRPPPRCPKAAWRPSARRAARGACPPRGRRDCSSPRHRLLQSTPSDSVARRPPRASGGSLRSRTLFPCQGGMPWKHYSLACGARRQHAKGRAPRARTHAGPDASATHSLHAPAARAVRARTARCSRRPAHATPAIRRRSSPRISPARWCPPPRVDAAR